MEFDFLDRLQGIIKKTVENDNIKETEIDLAHKLDAIEEFSIDRFEDNIAVLENRKNGEKINIDKNNLPKDIKEGDIVKKINGKYILDVKRTESESNRIENKMNNLWK